MDKLLTEKIGNLLSDKLQSIVIVTHTNPDGDAIGSCLALRRVMFHAGFTSISVIIPNGDPVFLHWMKDHEMIINATQSPQLANQLIESASIVFCLDFNHLNRAESVSESLILSKAVKILIDHHPEPGDGFDVLVSTTMVSSTAELVYEFILLMGWEEFLDKYIAECIYTGIVTDTGSFSYNCNYPRTYEILSDIMKWQIDGGEIHRKIYSTFSEKRMRLLGYCLSEKLVVIPNYQTAYISLSRKELNRYDHQIGDTEGIVNYALSLQGINLAALFTENKDYIKISLRSSGAIDVNDLARKHFSGGGHMNASGGKSFVGLEETVSIFERIVKQRSPVHV